MADDLDPHAYCRQQKPADASLDLGYIGSLFPGKGAEGGFQIAETRPKHRFHIVGGSRDEIQALKCQAPANVVFHGRVAPGRVREMARSFDVLLLPSRHRVEAAGAVDIGAYTSPLKLFEYMAAGRPVIASRLPVLEEVLASEHNALLAEPDAPEQWAAAIDRLVADVTLREALARRALVDLLNEYTWDQRAEHVLA